MRQIIFYIIIFSFFHFSNKNRFIVAFLIIQSNNNNKIKKICVNTTRRWPRATTYTSPQPRSKRSAPSKPSSRATWSSQSGNLTPSDPSNFWDRHRNMGNVWLTQRESWLKPTRKMRIISLLWGALKKLAFKRGTNRATREQKKKLTLSKTKISTLANGHTINCRKRKNLTDTDVTSSRKKNCSTEAISKTGWCTEPALFIVFWVEENPKSFMKASGWTDRKMEVVNTTTMRTFITKAIGTATANKDKESSSLYRASMTVCGSMISSMERACSG